RKTQASTESAAASRQGRPRPAHQPAAAAISAYEIPWFGLYMKLAIQKGGTGGRELMATDESPSTANAISTPVQPSGSGASCRRRDQYAARPTATSATGVSAS